MGSVWLAETGVPELIETDPGVFEFSQYGTGIDSESVNGEPWKQRGISSGKGQAT